MRVRKRAAGWTDDTLLKVAERFFIDHKTIQDIGKEVAASRQTVARMLGAAVQEGLVRIILSPRGKYQDFKEIEERIRELYPWIEYVSLVPGHPVKFGEVQNPILKDGVLFNIAEAASRFLVKQLRTISTIAVGSGSLVKSSINAVRLAEPRWEVKILPMQGSFGIEQYPSSANEIVNDLQRLTYGKAYWLPVPATAASENEYSTFCEIPSVKKILLRLGKCDVVVIGLGTITKGKLWYLRRLGAISRHDVKLLNPYFANESKEENPPVGEIGGRVFLADGSDYKSGWQVIGLSLEDMRKMVESRSAKVVAVVGGDSSRVDSILGALRGRFINCLITDHVSAREVIRRTEQQS